MLVRTFLFIHPNFPAQFRYLVPWLLSKGHRVIFLCDHPPSTPAKTLPDNLYIIKTAAHSKSDASGYLEMATTAERFKTAILQFLKENLTSCQPDVIICHSGWGAGVYAREFFPKSKIISYLEWWFKPCDAEFTFTDMSYPWISPYSDVYRHKQITRNYTQAIELLNSDYIVSPTMYQSVGLPNDLTLKSQIIYDFVNYFEASPLQSRLSSVPDEFILTYATRGLEPMRGFPEFVLAVTEALKTLDYLKVIVAGSDRSHYHPKPAGINSFKSWALQTFASNGVIDRVKFVGTLPYKNYIELLQGSRLHCYLSRPFVPSWSLLDAMSVGTPLIVSDITPTRELCHPRATIWTDHRNHGELCASIIETVKNLAKLSPIDAYKSYGYENRVVIKNRHSKKGYFSRWAELLGIPS